MKGFVRSLLFFGLVSLILGLAHYYVWRRLVRDLALSRLPHRFLTAALVLLYALVLLAIVTVGRLGPAYGGPLALVAFGWLGVLLLLVTLLLFAELGRAGAAGLRLLAQPDEPMDPTRRVALSRLLGGLVALMTLGLGGVATRSGLARVQVKRVAVGLERLPAAMNGTRIVQLTDVHIGGAIARDFVDEVVEQVNALKPDVIAITGDLVDGSVETLRRHVAPLARLQAKYGVYFVTGNHEYYSGCSSWCTHLTELGLRVLRNERVSIGEGDASFDLAGIDDFQARRYPGETGPDLARALGGRDPRRELVLLAHQPKAIHEAERLGVGLQLSGHTHGGQIWPWKYLVGLTQPVVSGLERIGNALVYVSNGTGHWGPPMRLGAPAEITEVVLSRRPHA